MKRHFNLTLLLIAALIIALMVIAFWNYTQDDVFITYVFSRNIARGEGFVFNPGERVQGSTTPLWALLMAGVHLFVAPENILHAGNVIGGVFLWLACAFALLWTQPFLSRGGRAALILLIASSPLVYVSLGMETLLYCALLFAGYWLWSRDRRIAALLVAAALTWTRADGIVLGGTFGLLAIYDTLRKHQSFSTLVRQGTAYAAGIAPWFLFAWVYFGTPLPQTFSAKQATFQGLLWWIDGLGRWQSFYGAFNPLALIGVLLLPVGAWAMWRDARLRPAVLWAACYFIGYTILNVTNFWYYTPLVVTLIAIAVFGGETVTKWIINASTRRGVLRHTPTVALIIAVMIAGFGIVRSLDFAAPPPRMNTYRLVGEWINANTPPDAAILVGDLGVVGYWAQRYTLDSPGLIVPSMLIRTPTYAVSKFKPDYVIATQAGWWREVTDSAWFRMYYMPLAQISTTGDHEFSPMGIYRRRYPLDTPSVVIEGQPIALNCRVTLPAGSALPDSITATIDGSATFNASQPFLWNTYPEPVTVGEETLPEQIMLAAQFPSGMYEWSSTCGDQSSSGTLEVLPFISSTDVVTTNAEWGNSVALRGIRLPDGTETWSGGTLIVALRFAALETPPADYTLTLQLLNAEGVLIAQNDAPPRAPLGDARPTTTWQNGETIIDVREIALPPDLPAGEYRLIVGWYDATGARWLLNNGDDHYVLPVTITNRFSGGSGIP